MWCWRSVRRWRWRWTGCPSSCWVTATRSGIWRWQLIPRVPHHQASPAAGAGDGSSPPRWTTRAVSGWVLTGVIVERDIPGRSTQGFLSTHLMQLFHFLQFPLVLQDETISSGPPSSQVLFSTHISHWCVQHFSPPPLHPCSWQKKHLLGWSSQRNCSKPFLRKLTWASCVRHLAQAQLKDTSDSIAKTWRFNCIYIKYSCIKWPNCFELSNEMARTAGWSLIPVRGFGVSTPKQVPKGPGRGDLSISGVEDHADVFGNNSRLDAMVQLRREESKRVSCVDINKDIRWRQIKQKADWPPDMQRGSCRSSPHKEWLCLAEESCVGSCPTQLQSGRKSWKGKTKKKRQPICKR